MDITSISNNVLGEAIQAMDSGVYLVQCLRIKDEIKFLCIKKQHLNQQIYHLHLSLANTWNNTWSYIQHTIEEKLQKETQTKYKNLDNKLNKLAQEQTATPRE